MASIERRCVVIKDLVVAQLAILSQKKFPACPKKILTPRVSGFYNRDNSVSLPANSFFLLSNKKRWFDQHFWFCAAFNGMLATRKRLGRRIDYTSRPVSLHQWLILACQALSTFVVRCHRSTWWMALLFIRAFRPLTTRSLCSGNIDRRKSPVLLTQQLRRSNFGWTRTPPLN